LQEFRPQLQSDVDSLNIFVQEEDKSHIQLLSETDLIRTTEVEDERPVHFQNEGDSVNTMEAEEEHDAHSQDDVNSVNIKIKRMPLFLTEETVDH
jgi:hypothetical protein